MAACRSEILSSSQCKSLVQSIRDARRTLVDLRHRHELGRVVRYWLTPVGPVWPFAVDSPNMRVTTVADFSAQELQRSFELFASVGRRSRLWLRGMIEFGGGQHMVSGAVDFQQIRYDGRRGLHIRISQVGGGGAQEVQRSLQLLFGHLITVCDLEEIISVKGGGDGSFEIVTLCSEYELKYFIHSGGRSPKAFQLLGFPSESDVIRRVKLLIDDSAFAAESIRLGLGIPYEELETVRPQLNEFTFAWEYHISGGYKPGFDPVAPECDVAADGPIRLPLLYEEDDDGGPALQVDIVHTREGSFLEMQSTMGNAFLQNVAESVNLSVEFWSGPVQRRWSGTGEALTA